MRRGGGGNMVEKRRAARKNLEADSLDLVPLQALEIPQNGQSFVWKCLDENTSDLEKLAIRLQARLDSAAGARRRTIGAGLAGGEIFLVANLKKSRSAKVILLRRRRGGAVSSRGSSRNHVDDRA